MYTVDLNSDLGESFGNYKIGNDDKIIPLISSANVACGYHASDPVVMGNTLAMAKEAGIRIGAHPGFPDLMGFGRRNLSVSPAEAKAYVLYQLGALDAFCRVTGVKMQHVKPHGALYNMAAEDYALSTAICEAIKEFDSSLIVLALSGGQLAKAAQDMGLRTAMEVSLWSKRKRLLQLQEKILIFRQILSAFMETEPRLWRLWKKSERLLQKKESRSVLWMSL